MRTAIWIFLSLFLLGPANAQGDSLVTDTAMVFGYVEASGTTSQIHRGMLNRAGSGEPFIEAEVNDGLFFVLGLPKGEYRVVSFRGTRRVISKFTSVIDLGLSFRFLVDGPAPIFLGAYRYSSDGARVEQKPSDPIATTFRITGPALHQEQLNEPSEIQLLNRVERDIATKSRWAAHRHLIVPIAKRKAEIESGESLNARIQAARSSGQWSSVVMHLRNPANSGDPVSLTALAQMYSVGLGVPVSLEQALQMYSKAAAQKYAPALFHMGNFLLTTTGPLKNPTLGSTWLDAAAALGYSEAEFALGQLAHSGARGLVDEAQALYWYKKAADQGFARAWTNLGVLSATAKALPRDLAQARIYFQNAAAAGESKAHFNLAQDYFRDNTSSSLERAYFHALLAENGDARQPCIPPALWVAARVETARRDQLPLILREEAARQSCMRSMPARPLISQIENRTGLNALPSQRLAAIRQEALDYLAKRILIDTPRAD